MTVEKGLSEEVADKIGEYVGLKGESKGPSRCNMAVLMPGPGFELLEKLEADSALNGVASAKQGLEDMRKLFTYLEVFGVLPKVRSVLPKRNISLITAQLRHVISTRSRLLHRYNLRSNHRILCPTFHPYRPSRPIQLNHYRF